MPDSVRDQRRHQIVVAARRIVAEQGLDALTFGALEERLAFTRGVITYHFASKDEIVRAVFTSAIEEIDAAVRAGVDAAPSIEDKIRAIIRGNVRGYVDRAEAGRVLLSFWGHLSSDGEIRRINAELYARYRAHCAKVVAKARAARAIADVDPGTMATVLVGIVLGIATQHYFEPGAIDVDAAIDEGAESVIARVRTGAVAAKARGRRTATR